MTDFVGRTLWSAADPRSARAGNDIVPFAAMLLAVRHAARDPLLALFRPTGILRQTTSGAAFVSPEK